MAPQPRIKISSSVDKTCQEAEWRVTWRSFAPDGCAPELAEWSEAHQTPSSLKEAALRIVGAAHGAEVLLSVARESGSFAQVFTARYELQRWRPEFEELPIGIESRWEQEVRARGEALRYYSKIGELLTEAALAGVIRRGSLRDLHSRARDAILGLHR